MSELLAGVRVLESAMLFNGDRLGALLGDLGADVVKVENPEGGDYLRDMLGQLAPHFSPAFVQVNRHKRSITIDLRKDKGRDVFWRLLDASDVFVDGNTADACSQLGIGYDEQRARKPDIVYCQYTGFGATGPYRSIPTHGQMMDALAGALPVELGADGAVRRKSPGSTMTTTEYGGEGHATGAVYAALHVAAALFRKTLSGEGCYIDAASSDAVIANAWVGATYSINGPRIRDPGSVPSDDLGPKYSFYATRDDRFVLFCCIEPRFWDRFCRATSREDLIPRQAASGPVDFGTADPDLGGELSSLFRTRSQAEWLELATRHHLPIGPAPTSPSELPGDPHLRAREIFYEARHPRTGPFTYVGQPAIVSGQPFRITRHAPALGQHTDEILRELGYGMADIERFRSEGVV
jgi:crotonobetainyl-CoA:carnitine CoA-transferase CaiB-like acyl-CoA transferase